MSYLPVAVGADHFLPDFRLRYGYVAYMCQVSVLCVGNNDDARLTDDTHCFFGGAGGTWLIVLVFWSDHIYFLFPFKLLLSNGLRRKASLTGEELKNWMAEAAAWNLPHV